LGVKTTTQILCAGVAGSAWSDLAPETVGKRTAEFIERHLIKEKKKTGMQTKLPPCDCVN
jgi:hypothetical protein